MNRRRGFTLIEVLVSLVLSAVVVLLVYGTAQAARDTAVRLRGERHALDGALAMRLLLENALAGAQPRFIVPDTMFLLERREGSHGVPRDRLRFVASGDLPPLSPGADWDVTLEPTAGGLRLSGQPEGVRIPPRVLAVLPGITGLGVRVRPAGESAEWTARWERPSELPAAVELTYWTDVGRIGLPLTVSVALGGAR